MTNQEPIPMIAAGGKPTASGPHEDHLTAVEEWWSEINDSYDRIRAATEPSDPYLIYAMKDLGLDPGIVRAGAASLLDLQARLFDLWRAGRGLETSQLPEGYDFEVDNSSCTAVLLFQGSEVGRWSTGADLFENAGDVFEFRHWLYLERIA